MREELIEQLYCNHPHVFQKSETVTKDDTIVKFELPDAWFNIVDSLLTCIERNVKHSENNLDIVMGSKDSKAIAEAEAAVARDLYELPMIIRITKASGKLYVYTTDCNPTNYAYIIYAMEISGRTCERCGGPGSRNGFWSSCFCENCVKHVRKTSWGDFEVFD